ncbi:hypothetical protein [Phenylobacterium sp.]|uniref:hypothetical protein n=1 Tax=Phenylobacterium sp. TaxID=1871053 RepID=UPI002FC6FC55
MSPLATRILELDAQGFSRVQIAERLGCTRVYAWMVVKAHGRPIPPSGHHDRHGVSPRKRRVGRASQPRDLSGAGA